jgi:hypothetical protein
VTPKLGLSINEAKTSLKNAPVEDFDLPQLYVRAAIRPWREAISRRASFEEEPETDQRQDQRSVEAVRDGRLAGGA